MKIDEGNAEDWRELNRERKMREGMKVKFFILLLFLTFCYECEDCEKNWRWIWETEGENQEESEEWIRKNSRESHKIRWVFGFYILSFWFSVELVKIQLG